jgi:hypothetical protein
MNEAPGEAGWPGAGRPLPLPEVTTVLPTAALVTRGAEICTWWRARS